MTELPDPPPADLHRAVFPRSRSRLEEEANVEPTVEPRGLGNRWDTACLPPSAHSNRTARRDTAPTHLFAGCGSTSPHREYRSAVVPVPSRHGYRRSPLQDTRVFLDFLSPAVASNRRTNFCREAKACVGLCGQQEESISLRIAFPSKKRQLTCWCVPGAFLH